MFLLIGLTGPPGSGKGTVANILSKMAQERGVKVFYFSLSDEIRNELGRQEVRIERENLKQTANWLRSRMGNGVWASIAASRIEDLLDIIEDVQVLILVDSIRNVGEVFEFRARFGDRFKLLGVTAPPETIRENMRRRERVDETKEVLNDDERLQKLIEAEMGLGEPTFGHNVATCIEKADLPLIFNDGTLLELEEKVHNIASQDIFPLLS